MTQCYPCLPEGLCTKSYHSYHVFQASKRAERFFKKYSRYAIAGTQSRRCNAAAWSPWGHYGVCPDKEDTWCDVSAPPDESSARFGLQSHRRYALSAVSPPQRSAASSRGPGAWGDRRWSTSSLDCLPCDGTGRSPRSRPGHVRECPGKMRLVLFRLVGESWTERWARGRCGPGTIWRVCIASCAADPCVRWCWKLADWITSLASGYENTNAKKNWLQKFIINGKHTQSIGTNPGKRNAKRLSITIVTELVHYERTHVIKQLIQLEQW